MDAQDRWPLTSHWPEWTWERSERLRHTCSESQREARDTKRWADRHGNAELSQLCEFKVEQYGRYLAEFDQRDQVAREHYRREHRQWVARSRYAGSRNGLWADVLRWARVGELPLDWRDHLPGYHARWAAIAGVETTDDVDGLVVHEFVTLEPQPWEPDVAAGDWRTALDAWYRDTLALHDRRHQQRVELDADEPRRFAEPWPPEVGAHLACREADLAAIKVINHARKRDRIEAWYRAGLAAGGGDEHWLDWYRQRIDAWDDRHDAIYSVGLIAAGDELVILDDPVNRAQMQTLPDYWRH